MTKEVTSFVRYHGYYAPSPAWKGKTPAQIRMSQHPITVRYEISYDGQNYQSFNAAKFQSLYEGVIEGAFTSSKKETTKHSVHIVFEWKKKDILVETNVVRNDSSNLRQISVVFATFLSLVVGFQLGNALKTL